MKLELFFILIFFQRIYFFSKIENTSFYKKITKKYCFYSKINYIIFNRDDNNIFLQKNISYKENDVTIEKNYTIETTKEKKLKNSFKNQNFSQKHIKNRRFY